MRRGEMGLVALFIGAGMCASVFAFAQSGGPAPTPPNTTDMAKTPDLSPNQRILRDKAYQKPLDRAQAPTKSQVMASVSDLLAEMQVSCTVTDARLVSDIPAGDGGPATKTYETSCESGIGYFVISSDKADAFSCFAAEATRAKDLAEGRQPGIVCTLPANANTKAMAQAILTRIGARCQVSKVRWIGLSARAASEYTEAACSDGSGYVVTSPVPGSKSPIAAVTCQEAGRRGIFCTLSDSGQPTVNIETFRAELARHNLVCSAGDEDIRHIGQETAKKRHVVEFKCKEFPKGLVAYIPLSDSRAPFEAIDCAAAAKRNAQCTLQ